MRAHYLQHVPFECLGSIEPWLRGAGYEITSSPLFRSAEFPELEMVDFLIVMGGPMSVNDEDEFPWLIEEKRFIRGAIEAGKPVLGICLGAQLIASTLGARVYRNRYKEIGWFPVRRVPQPGLSSTFTFPPTMEVFHWHGDTYDLPPDAVLLARSEGCLNQAFQIGSRIIGLQFHLEMTPESVRAIVSHCGAELSPAKYVQSEAKILEAAPQKYQSINDLMVEVLSFLTCDRTGSC